MGVRSKNIKNKVYKFSHKEDEYIKTTILGKQFKSDDNFIELNENGVLSVNGSCKNGYSWDGCTPKWEFLDFTIGTPDGRFDYLTEKPITYYASMLHDALYQYKSEIPISRKDADVIFLKILTESGFLWAKPYYIVIRIFGSFFGKWKTKDRTKDLRLIESSWINASYKEATNLNQNYVKDHPFMSPKRFK